MMREYQVRFCEGLGVKFPGPTRRETTTSGEGLEINGHTHPTVTIDGNLKVVAAFLSKRLGSPRQCPVEVGQKKSPTHPLGHEEIAHALGLQLVAKK